MTPPKNGAGSKGGMFEATLRYGKPITQGHDQLNFDKLRVKKYNSTEHVLTGSFETKFLMDSNYNVMAYVYKKAGNDYKRMPYKYGPHNLCIAIEQEEFFYKELSEYTNFPEFPNCEFSPGIYHINDYLPDVSKLPPIFESGDYKLEVRIEQGEELINGFEIEVEIININNG